MGHLKLGLRGGQCDKTGRTQCSTVFLEKEDSQLEDSGGSSRSA